MVCKMRVLFIQPPYLPFEDIKYYNSATQHIPLGILYLSSVLKKSFPTITVEFIDLHLLLCKSKVITSDPNEFIKTALSSIKNEPDVVSITCNFNSNGELYELITDQIKTYWPRSIIITGGFLPTGAPNLFLKDSNTDFICLGEGEISLPKFIQSLIMGTSINIQGIYNKKNLVERTDLSNLVYSELIKSLDDIPIPDYSLLNGTISDYYVIPILFSRGCPNRCSFCAHNLIQGHHIRYRSIDSILGEIEYVVNKYGRVDFFINDANPTTNKNYFVNVISAIRRKFNNRIQLNLNIGIEVAKCDEEIISLIKNSGGSRIYLAVESASQYVLHALMNKKVDLEKAKFLALKSRKLGLFTGVYYILGMPGETADMRKETFEYAKSFPADWSTFSIATPLPGTKMYNECVQIGSIRINNLKDLSKLYFKKRGFDLPDISASELMDTQDRYDKIINYIDNYNCRSGEYERALSQFITITNDYPFQILAHLMVLKILSIQTINDSDKLVEYVRKKEEIINILRSNPDSKIIYDKYKTEPEFYSLCNQLSRENI